MRNKTKKTLKGIGLGVLGVATLIGAAATINHFKADEDGLVKVHLSYDIGGLDSNGEYEETDASIYTKNAFEADGLKVEVDFDSTINYEVFFYNQYGDFIKSTGALEKNFDADIPLNATHARIEITPQEDEDGIKWYEKSGYASQLTIKVNEKQKDMNLTENLFVYHGNTLFDHENASLRDGEGATSGEIIDISSYDKLLLRMDKKYLTDENFRFYVYDVGTTITNQTLDMNEYDIVEDGDMVNITIDNMNSFEKCLIAMFGTYPDFSVELYGIN